MPEGPSSRAMLCASARRACFAPAKAAKPAAPRTLAVAPVKIMVPLVLFILPCLFIIVMGPAAIGMMEAFGG